MESWGGGGGERMKWMCSAGRTGCVLVFTKPLYCCNMKGGGGGGGRQRMREIVQVPSAA